MVVFSNPIHIARADSNPHSPIAITGDDQFTSDNGVTGGSGTSSDPYTIASWAITPQNFGIEVANTTSYFTITNVEVTCGGSNNCFNGIVLSSVQNAVIQNSYINVGSGDGISVDNSQNFQITGNTVWGYRVIHLYLSTSFDVSYNFVQGGAFAIEGSYLSEASVVGNTGGGEDGITFDHISGFLISQNNVAGNVSIGVGNCGDLTIDGNTAQSAFEGIVVSTCNNVLVSNNNATRAIDGIEEGIWIENSDNVNVNSNTVSYAMNGIRLMDYATGNSITSNRITNSQCGIQTDSSSTIDQNNVFDNTFVGTTQDYCNL